MTGENGLRFLYGFAAGAAARGGLRGGLADQLRGPDGGDELFHAVIVEINGGAFRVGLRDGTHAVLLVTNGLPFH